jgi:hypothetical protein
MHSSGIGSEHQSLIANITQFMKVAGDNTTRLSLRSAATSVTGAFSQFDMNSYLNSPITIPNGTNYQKYRAHWEEGTVEEVGNSETLATKEETESALLTASGPILVYGAPDPVGRCSPLIRRDIHRSKGPVARKRTEVWRPVRVYLLVTIVSDIVSISRDYLFLLFPISRDFGNL